MELKQLFSEKNWSVIFIEEKVITMKRYFLYCPILYFLKNFVKVKQLHCKGNFQEKEKEIWMS